MATNPAEVQSYISGKFKREERGKMAAARTNKGTKEQGTRGAFKVLT